MLRCLLLSTFFRHLPDFLSSLRQNRKRHMSREPRRWTRDVGRFGLAQLIVPAVTWGDAGGGGEYGDGGLPNATLAQ